jgi:hypothetical protein
MPSSRGKREPAFSTFKPFNGDTLDGQMIAQVSSFRQPGSCIMARFIYNPSFAINGRSAGLCRFTEE